jgi:hypothetical protein
VRTNAYLETEFISEEELLSMADQHKTLAACVLGR